MGSQSRVSKGFGVAVVVVLGLLSTTTVITATTFTIGWIAPNPKYPGGFSVKSNQGVLNSGDSLLFQYNTKKHDLLSVTQDDFNNCNTSAPLHKWDDGNTTISHETPGAFFYICGTPGHCGSGQKLEVIVPAIAPSSAPLLGPLPGGPVAGAPVPTPPSDAVDLKPHATTSVMVAAAVILVLVSFGKL